MALHQKSEEREGEQPLPLLAGLILKLEEAATITSCPTEHSE